MQTGGVQALAVGREDTLTNQRADNPISHIDGKIGHRSVRGGHVARAQHRSTVHCTPGKERITIIRRTTNHSDKVQAQ